MDDPTEAIISKPTTLYRMSSKDGELLYVGITNRLPERLGKHQQEKPWWSEVASITTEHYPTRADARAAEAAAIEAEAPKWNVLGTPEWDERHRSGLAERKGKAMAQPAPEPAKTPPPPLDNDEDEEDDEPGQTLSPMWNQNRLEFWVGDRWMPASKIWLNPFC